MFEIYVENMINEKKKKHGPAFILGFHEEETTMSV